MTDTEALLAEQRRTNELLERIARNQPKRSRLCETGRRGECFGPWYMCAIFGCVVR